MNTLLWSLCGGATAIITLYLYVMISPAYKKGERFSLPLIPFFLLFVLHLFMAAVWVRFIAFGVDIAMLTWATALGLIEAQKKK